MKVLTINVSIIEKFNLKSIDNVYNMLVAFSVIPLVISCERDSSNINIHYHVLASPFDDVKSNELWLLKIFNEDVKNEIAYIEYILKQGNYKFFNGYEKPFKNDKKNSYNDLLNDIYINDLTIDVIRVKYPNLFLRYYKTINDMYDDIYFKKQRALKY